MRIKIFDRVLVIKLFAKRVAAPALSEIVEKGNASDLWWDSFCCGGSIVSDCACGRTNFIDSEDAGDWDEGELERLRELHREKPDQYVIDHGNDYVSISRVGLIWNCPCGQSKRYEDMLTLYQSEILSYYKKRKEKLVREAADITEDLSKASAE